MKSIKIASLILSICLGTSVLAINAYAATGTNASTTKADNAQTKKDGEILAVLITVDKNEIALAKLALTKDITPAINQYAHMLKKQHKQNLQEALQVIKKTGINPVDNETVVSMQKDGTKDMDTLSPLKGKDFDKAYIDAMVSGHTAVLKMLDDDLLKNATNPSLKEFVTATRTHIESHLQQGQTIQKELG